MNVKKIRIRFAPSPTGYMHIGNFRTALYAYLFAKKNGGDFILRIEDTDQKRFVPDALEKLINILNWAGFEYDEGVFNKFKVQSSKFKVIESKNYPEFVEVGDYGPYIQSERLEIYQKYAQELVKKGDAYYCFCSPERLEEMRNLQTTQKKAPMYDRTCLKLSEEEIAQKIKNGEPYVIRQKINPEGFTEFDDLIRGKVKIKNDLLDDQVLLKSDGYPTYNFANVIDDHLMEITHVMRGEEYISSTPKYTQLYQNFGWVEPKIAHLPLILNPNKSKLSKRQGDVAVEDYIQKRYPKGAIINFVALLGWNPGEGETQEIFSINELIEKFDLSHVHKAGAVFDIKKLNWISSEWIKKFSRDELYQYSTSPSFSPSSSPSLSPSLSPSSSPSFSPSPSPSAWEEKEFYNNAPKERKSKEYLKKVLAIEQDRLNNLSEVGENNRFFFEDIKYDKELLRWKKMTDEDLKESLEKSREVLEKIAETDWTKENLEKNLLKAAADKKGDLLWPLRAALTGEQKSPSPFECAWVLGKEVSLQRIDQALSLI